MRPTMAAHFGFGSIAVIPLFRSLNFAVLFKLASSERWWCLQSREKHMNRRYISTLSAIAAVGITQLPTG
jgi:hypothetical protein